MSFFDDPRWDDTREGPSRGRGGGLEHDPRDLETVDPRDVFTQSLDLPRGLDREPVSVGNDHYDVRGSEVRTLSIVGAFRVVPIDDLRDRGDRAADLWHGDLEHLRSEGLLRHVASVDRESGTDLVTLTDRGRALLESHRSLDHDPRQTFHDGPARERELMHDAQLYRAYLRAADRLVEAGAHIERVILEQDLRRDYQLFLQEPNCGRADSDGRPGRDDDEIRRWAEDRDLAYVDGRVQFPDFQIEFLWPDGRRDIENVEVLTPHYRGAHVAGKMRAGFTRFRGIGARAGGRTGRGSRFDPGLAEELV
ncbi:MAG: hypothetical protein ACRD2X_20790 [Vicinamibacteraceae bacterium]